MSGPRYGVAEWAPWQEFDASGRPAFWKGECRPVAVVLHTMAGYAATARAWAGAGHFGASWHFTVGRDGRVMQHLELDDAGYHAGIPDSAPAPSWPLWRGHGENVNRYTLGIEHEGFPGEPFPPEQAEASRALCRWLAEVVGVPLDRGHFPAHAEIDLLNRPNDFNTPALREAHYRYLLEEDEMTAEERARLTAVYEALVGKGNPGGAALLDGWNARGNSLLAGYALEQEKLAAHLAGAAAESAGAGPTSSEGRP